MSSPNTNLQTTATNSDGTKTTNRSSHPSHQVLLVNNLSVHFPFPPYDTQVMLMQQIAKAVYNAENALLQSQTGTGKTVAMFCAVVAAVGQLQQPSHPAEECSTTNQQATMLAARQLNYSPSQPASSATHVPNAVKRTTIYIVTKTHSQIQQIVREIRRCSAADVSVTVLASRSRLCLNEAVLSSPNVNHACHELNSSYRKSVETGVHRSSCAYHGHSFDDKLQQLSLTFNEDQTVSEANRLPAIADIEDLKEFGRSHVVCPYYFTKCTFKSADVVLCPYSFIVVPEIRKAARISLKNNVVVFDEAHNIPGLGRASMSWSTDSFALQRCARTYAALALATVPSGERKDAVAFDRKFCVLLQTVCSNIRAQTWFEIDKAFPAKQEQMRAAAAETETVVKWVFDVDMTDFLENNCSISKTDVHFLHDAVHADSHSHLFDVAHGTMPTAYDDIDGSTPLVVGDASKCLIRSLQNVFLHPRHMAIVLCMALKLVCCNSVKRFT